MQQTHESYFLPKSLLLILLHRLSASLFPPESLNLPTMQGRDGEEEEEEE